MIIHCNARGTGGTRSPLVPVMTTTEAMVPARSLMLSGEPSRCAPLPVCERRAAPDRALDNVQRSCALRPEFLTVEAQAKILIVTMRIRHNGCRFVATSRS